MLAAVVRDSLAAMRRCLPSLGGGSVLEAGWPLLGGLGGGRLASKPTDEDDDPGSPISNYKP
ncbi:hypothetical protein Dimus_013347, partial [Dionaea muscipula]